MAASVSMTVMMKMELYAGVLCVCGCDSDDEDGVVGWRSCVCGCDSDDEDSRRLAFLCLWL